MADTELQILDATLRDGSHAIKHQLTPDHVYEYINLLDKAGVHIAEVGHGLGLGASCAQVGFSAFSDNDLNKAAVAAASTIQICNFIIPGFATIERDLAPAMQQGVHCFRFGTHCTESDLAKRHIQYVSSQNGTAFASLMMSHMVSAGKLLEQALRFQDYGAKSVTLMDSAGAFTLSQTREKIALLADELDIKVGYHGHNNLGLSVANSIIAANEGASILDATARGFGAGAGNTPIDCLIAALHAENIKTGISLEALLKASNYAENSFINSLPVVSDGGVISGFYGVCGAFLKHVEKASLDFDVPANKIFEELANRKSVAGQEDMIIEIAAMLKGNVDAA